MAKYRFKGDASKNEMHPITREQFNAIKLAHESQYKRIEILYNDKTISMLKEITGVAGSDASIFNAFIKKITHEYGRN
jgi:hypothetical protein